jgi:hypothetical protein
VVGRRQIFFVGGYHPLAAEGYYDLLGRSLKRTRGAWGCEAKLGTLVLDSDLIAHWDIDAAGPNWRVAARYEFLRLDGIVRANMAEPLWRQLPRALAWMADDLVSGTALRVMRAAWRFELHFIYFQVLLLLWLALSLGGGALAAVASMRLAGLGVGAAIAIGVVCGLLVFRLLRPLADWLQVVQINNCWPYLRELARGEASAFDSPIEEFAARVVAAARAGDCDEIVVVGHSAGSISACATMARALELDPELGRHGPAIVLLTLGSVMPATALHPAAQRMRAMVRRLALDPHVKWIDCVSRKDVMNFRGFDLVAALGILPPATRANPRENPLTWTVQFKDAVSPEYYRRLRRQLFRLHFQFIVSGDRRSAYDYLMLVAGPVAVADWARKPAATAAAFGPDGAFTGETNPMHAAELGSAQ